MLYELVATEELLKEWTLDSHAPIVVYGCFFKKTYLLTSQQVCAIVTLVEKSTR